MPKILRYTIYTAPALLFLVPFIVSDNLFFPFIVGKNLMFRVLVGVMLVSWLLLLFRDRSYLPKKSWVFGALSFFVGWMFVAAVFGVNFSHSIWSNFERMEGWITLIHLLGLFVVLASVFKTNLEWKRVFYGATAVSTFIALSAVLERLTHTAAELDRVSISFGNPTYLGGYLLIHFFILLFLWYKDREDKSTSFIGDWKNWLFALATMFFLLGMWFAGSRGTILGLLGGAGLITLLFIIWGRAYPMARKISAGLLVTLLILLGGFFAFKDSSFVQDSDLLSRFANISLTEGTSGTRVTIWQMGIESALERPLTGWGQGNFISAFAQNFRPSLYGQEAWFDRTHNIFINWFVDGGILGGLAYIALFITSLFAIWRSRMSFPEKAIFTALLGGYAIHNSFVFDNITSYIPFTILLAFFHFSHVGARGEKELAPLLPDEGTRNYASFAVLVGGVAGIFFLNMPIYVQGSNLIQGLRAANAGAYEVAYEHLDTALEKHPVGRQEAREQFAQKAIEVLGSPDVSLEIKELFINRAHEELEAQIQENPSNIRSNPYYVTILQIRGMTEEAIETTERSLEISPKRQLIYFQLANIYENSGEMEKALEAYKKTVDLDPSKREPHIRYSITLIKLGRVSEARSYLSDQLDTDIIVEQRIISALNDAEAYSYIIDILEKNLEEKPQNQQSYSRLIAAYYKAGQYKEAIELVREMGEQFPEVQSEVPDIIKAINARVLPVE